MNKLCDWKNRSNPINDSVEIVALHYDCMLIQWLAKQYNTGCHGHVNCLTGNVMSPALTDHNIELTCGIP
jgi:hypothetical protein